MTDRELRKLRRQDLLQMLLDSEKENLRLRKELEACRSELEKRQTDFVGTGSVEEAARTLSEIFEDAQRAAFEYRSNVENVCDEREEKVRQVVVNAQRYLNEMQERCRTRERETEEHCRARERETEEYCRSITERTKQETEAFLTGLRQRFADHPQRDPEPPGNRSQLSRGV